MLKKQKRVFGELNCYFSLSYDQVGSIGKRYTRQDLIGTPYCLTIDHQTLEDDTLTVRERDSMEQVRMPIAALKDYLNERVGMETLLNKIDA